jgi:hypothetical protein
LRPEASIQRSTMAVIQSMNTIQKHSVAAREGWGRAWGRGGKTEDGSGDWPDIKTFDA